MIKAPWNLAQVFALNTYQRLGYAHEFTCPHDHGEPGSYILRATPDGWVCPRCDYTQDWAHDYMADLSKHPKSPIENMMLKSTSLVEHSIKRHKADPGECTYCDRERAAGNDFHPSHDASRCCKSGKRDHCSCDSCF